MKKIFPIIISVLLVFISCKGDLKKNTIEKWKNEIVQTEKEFAEMAVKEGIQAAFVAYAATDVVIVRNNILISGKDGLKDFYQNRASGSEKVSLTWKPDFVDVAASGDLGYTYGKWIFTSTDSLGNSKTQEGIFHTVWKRQPDGKWRFVWD